MGFTDRLTARLNTLGRSNSVTGLNRLSKLTTAVATFTTPLVPADYAGLFHPLRGREIRGRIISVERHPDFTTLTIEPGSQAAAMFSRFHAGQFIGLGVQVEGRWMWRCYSLTNAPKHKGPKHKGQRHHNVLSVSVRPVPDGVVSTRIADHLSPGTIIRLSAPGGDFHLPDPVPAKVLFITAGAGVTPVISILRWLRAHSDSEDFPDVIHLHSERATAPSEPFGTELHALEASEPNYRLVHRNSITDGRIQPEEITTLVPDLEERTVLACGPEALLDTLRKKIPNIRTESFHAPDLPGSVTSADLGGEIILGTTGVTASSTGTTPILDAAEAAGVPLVHGCRMGICRTCTVSVTEGTAVDLRDGAIYGPGEQVRTCCSVPSGVLKISVS